MLTAGEPFGLGGVAAHLAGLATYGDIKAGLDGGDGSVLARVVGIVAGASGRWIVHLDVLGVPEATIDELRHAQLLPS